MDRPDRLGEPIAGAMRLGWVAAALSVTALAVLVALAGNALKGQDEPPTASVAAPSPDVPAAPEAIPRTAAVRARPVNPALVAPPQIDASDLERVEPRGPLGDIALALPPKQAPPERTLLYQPVATAAGLLEAGGHKIALDGIAAITPEQECRATDGSSWPCGMVARTAFRNWLRGRAVACTVGEPPARETVITACDLGNEDVALWLVKNGFAVAQPGRLYAEAGEKAKAESRGIFGPGPATD